MQNGNIRLNVSNSLLPFFSDEKIQILRYFLAYCYRSLDLSGAYEGSIVDSRKEYGIKTTAICNPNYATFFVYGKNRAFVDVLRSIAHELAHIKQHENQENDESIDFHLHFSSKVEDEANALAGELVNAFADVIGYNVIYEAKK